MSQTITAEQIHKDFYGAEERLYVEAVGLSKGSLVNKSDKAERLRKIGFGMAKPIKDDKILNEKRKVAGHMVNVIEYFRTYYPHYKFITEAEVKVLCEKYGLLLGDASHYTGDMPEKNLQDIEKFKLRKEDWKEKTSIDWMSSFGMFIPQRSIELNQWGSPIGETEFRPFQQQERRRGSELYSQFLRQYLDTPIRYVSGVDPYADEPKKKDKEYEQPAFKICAPKQDFNTSGFIVQDGYKLIYDPIVLQPVSKEGIEGYLIVTAWGDEASDELVVNQTNN